MVQLQQLDEKIRVQQRRLASIPPELGEREAGYAAREAALGQIEADRKGCLARSQDLENDVLQAEERIGRLEQQTLEARDATSVTVATHEAEQLRAKTAGLQDEALSLLEEAETLEQQRDSERTRLKEEAEELASFRSNAQRDEADLGAGIAALQAEREALCAPLTSQLLQDYKRIADARKGLVVVQLKGRSCGGCGMSLKPNDLIRIEKAAVVVTCSSCGRILVTPATWASGD